ncbi:MAG: tRNA epoxyqueuosine(34) reductase QueG [Chloroflexota bacterium]
MLPAAELRLKIESEAQRLGFDLLGVTSPLPPPHAGVYQDWLARGCHGEMAYLAAGESVERRLDPRRILPECRSVLVLGMPYHPHPPAGFPPDTPSSGPAGEHRGCLAAYTWGDDYHEVLVERLRRLAAYIETELGAPVAHRIYTDTGPLLERDLAQRAGLGWIGKNTCLIHPQRGSYFLLAELLLGIDLPHDQPFTADHCGACRRCIDACPTDCIQPDRTLDARRCISYLTIELKGPIPLELRPQVGEWIFGCDICQQVCPWNVRFARPAAEPAFQARPGVPRPRLQDELQLDAQAFNRKFKGSPVKRAKRRGYLRNVAVALGNTHDPAVVPALIGALGDPEPLVRAHAAWALGRIGGAAALQALQQALWGEPDPYARAEIAAALDQSGRA